MALYRRRSPCLRSWRGMGGGGGVVLLLVGVGRSLRSRRGPAEDVSGSLRKLQRRVDVTDSPARRSATDCLLYLSALVAMLGGGVS